METVIISKITSYHESDDYQFGFKRGHSTAHCTNLMKTAIDYYTKRGSNVFACFFDFKKAFDRVNYWKLFNKLMDDGIPSDVVALLSFWYSHQKVNVRWHNMLSDSFCIKNGTRQGGILSPYLFTRYIRDVLSAVVNTHIGCNIGGVMINVLAYADDIVLLAPSWSAMQNLIVVLETNSKDIDMVCNVDKTLCMVFKPKCRTNIVTSQFPNLMINDKPLYFVDEFRYLGHIINHDFTDDNDIKREIRNLFMRTNLLIRRFNKCSVAVKCMLFKSYCVCLYDAALWSTFRACTFQKLKSAYNKCVKIFFGYSRSYSVTSMLQEIGLPTFSVLMHNYRLSFLQQWTNSINYILKYVADIVK